MLGRINSGSQTVGHAVPNSATSENSKAEIPGTELLGTVGSWWEVKQGFAPNWWEG